MNSWLQPLSCWGLWLATRCVTCHPSTNVKLYSTLFLYNFSWGLLFKDQLGLKCQFSCLAGFLANVTSNLGLQMRVFCFIKWSAHKLSTSANAIFPRVRARVAIDKMAFIELERRAPKSKVKRPQKKKKSVLAEVRKVPGAGRRCETNIKNCRLESINLRTD